MIFFQPSWHTS